MSSQPAQTVAPVVAHPTPPAAFAMLAGTVLILGLNWPLSKVALDSIGPLWLTTLRAGGAMVVVGVVRLFSGGLRRPPRGDWPVVVSVGLAGIAGLYGLVFTGLQYVPPGRSSVLVWTTSLWTVPIAWLALSERMNRLRWSGLAVGVAGIVALFEPWRFAWSDSQVLLGHGLLIAGAVVNASVTVHMRGHRWVSGPTDVLFWQLLIGTAVLAVVALAREGPLAADWSAPLVGIIVYQAVGCSAFAVWAQQMAVRTLRAITAGLVLMAVPVVGLLASIVTLGETITAVGILGVTAVGVGVALSILGEDDSAGDPARSGECLSYPSVRSSPCGGS